MVEIKDNELLMLVILVALQIPIDKNEQAIVDYSKQNYTVKDMVEFYLNGKQENRFIDRNSFSLMEETEWEDNLLKIVKKPTLLVLKLICIIHDSSCGLNAFCFQFCEDSAIVIFGGSVGNGWKDNGQGGFEPDTNQQKAALAFVNKLDYERLIVTGHSKGGNNAQYVTLLCSKVVRGVSFDGQGFSDNFLNKYKKEIKTGSKKIIAYNGEYDFVHALLYGVAGRELEISTDFQIVIWNNHKPSLMLDKEGNFRIEVKRNLFIEALHIWSMKMSTMIPDAYGLDMVDVLFDRINGTNNVDGKLFLQGSMIMLPLMLDEKLISSMISERKLLGQASTEIFYKLYTICEETSDKLKFKEKINFNIIIDFLKFLYP